MPRLNFDDMFSAQRAAIDALISAGSTALASAERMAALNLHAVREAMLDFAEGTQRMLAAKSPRDAVGLHDQLSKPQVEKGVRYSRSLYEMSTVAQEDAVHIIEAQYNGFMESMTELANQIAKTTPIGSEVAVAAIRSTMRSAHDAFERFNEAVVRYTEVAEDSVSTLGNATVKAATGKTTAKKAAPRKAVPARRK